MALVDELNVACKEIVVKGGPFDVYFKGTPMYKAVQKWGHVETTAGAKIEASWEYAKSTTGGWFGEGDLFDITRQKLTGGGQWDWKAIYQSVVITDFEKMKNAGPKKIFDLADMRVRNAKKSMVDSFEAALFNSGSDAKAIQGARYFISTSNSPGGVSQATYSWHQGTVNATSYSYAQLTSSDAAITTAQYVLTKLYLDAMGGSTGDEAPSVFCVDTQAYMCITMALKHEHRFVVPDPTMGWENLKFGPGRMAIWSSAQAPAYHVIMLSPRHIHWYNNETMNNVWVPFRPPINQGSLVGQLKHGCALVVTNNTKQAMATNFGNKA